MDMIPDSSTDVKTINIALYRDIKNMPDIRQKLISGEFKCCVINPSLILHPLQVVVAANKAITAKTLTTKSIFTEILFNLSLSKNITQSLTKFSVSDASTDGLFVIPLKEESDNEEDLLSIVDGTKCKLSELGEIADLNAIKKAYKITEIEEKTSPLVQTIVSKISTKDFVV